MSLPLGEVSPLTIPERGRISRDLAIWIPATSRGEANLLIAIWMGKLLTPTWEAITSEGIPIMEDPPTEQMFRILTKIATTQISFLNLWIASSSHLHNEINEHHKVFEEKKNKKRNPGSIHQMLFVPYIWHPPAIRYVCTGWLFIYSSS